MKERAMSDRYELERECDRLKKELKAALKRYDDLRYHEIICPGEAARYYLEECRKLRKENEELKKEIREKEIAMDRKPITEEMCLEKEWFEKARKIETIEDLTSFVSHILNDYYHDYGTACHAVAACALAGAWLASREEGITGFQAGFVMWDFIKQWNKTGNECGLRLVDYDDMLFPQCEYEFQKTIDVSVWEKIKKQAKENLEKNPDAHPEVIEHWTKITQGIVPFGYQVQ